MAAVPTLLLTWLEVSTYMMDMEIAQRLLFWLVETLTVPYFWPLFFSAYVWTLVGNLPFCASNLQKLRAVQESRFCRWACFAISRSICIEVLINLKKKGDKIGMGYMKHG